jgi:hypothetical protein
MNYLIHQDFLGYKSSIHGIIENFEAKGKPFGNQDRNVLKLFDLEGKTIIVKSFKIPNIFNQVGYKFFRKSKAQRSFEYANKLLELGVGTPQPVAYYEFKTPFLFKKSYYLSEHLEYDLTFRQLTTDFNYPDYENILRAFTRFTYGLHQKDINFLDHSPGNTLIKKNEEAWDFYLVDLNRMRFETMDFNTRMKNMSRLTIHRSMVEIMSDEYAKRSGEDYDSILNSIWNETQAFQHRFHRKRRIKNRVLFWRQKRD